MKSYTNRGSKWEWLHSWYILLSFFSLGFVGFLYIGHKVNYRKWTLWGLIYGIVLTFAFISGEIGMPGIGALCGFGGWIACIVHSFVARKTFLIRLDEKMNTAPDEIEQIRQEARKSYGKPVEKELKEQIVEHVGAKEETPKAKQPVEPTEKIDVNHCTSEQLKALPFVSAAMAIKAEQHRKEQGDFKSIDEFFEAVGISKPHQRVKLLDMLVCSYVEVAEPTQQPKGRKLDL